MSLLISALFLSLSWLTAVHLLPWVSWHNEIWAFAAVLWAMWGLLLSQRSTRGSVAFPIAVWPLALLAVVVAVQVAIGRIGFAGDGWVLVFYLVLCIGAMGVGYAIGTSPDGQGKVLMALQPFAFHFATLMLAVGICSVIVALAQALTVWETSIWIHRIQMLRRPGANLGQPNQLATFFLFAVASLVYLFEAGRLRVFVALPITTALLFGLALTESRSGALGLLLMAVWWTLKRRPLGFSLSPRAVGLWIIFFVACFVAWPHCLNYILMGVTEDSLSADVNVHSGTRSLVWPQLWQATLQRPWFGWGLREVSAAHNTVLAAYDAAEPFTYAHNLVLELAVGTGWPLTMLLVAVTSAWLWNRVRGTNDMLSWYCLAVILPFGLHSMLEFPFTYAYLLVPVMLLLGILEAKVGLRRAVRIPWWGVTAGWAVASACMAWSVVEYVSIEDDFRIARFEATSIGKTPGDYERPHIFLLTQMDALLEGVRLVPTPNMTSQRIELARKVAMRFPTIPIQNRYALSLALNGQKEEARRQLHVMRAMHGKKAYAEIAANWGRLAREKYPELTGLEFAEKRGE